METYVILRRGGWRTSDELRAATERSTAEGDAMRNDIRWLRSYVLADPSGGLGTVCVFQASSPEALRMHACRACLPVDEIVAVADTIVIRPDPLRVAS